MAITFALTPLAALAVNSGSGGVAAYQIIAILLLITGLVVKDVLLGSPEPKAKQLSKTLNLAIVPLTVAVVAILVLKMLPRLTP